MNRNAHPHRPAIAAIAVVLALSSTPLVAQETIAPDAGPTTVPPTVDMAPQAPIPTVQTLPPPPPLLPLLELDEPRPILTRTESSRADLRASQARAVSPPAASPATRSPATRSPTQPAPTSAPGLTEQSLATPTPVDRVAASAARQNGGVDEQAGMLLLGGGLQILAAGATALGLARRRRPEAVEPIDEARVKNTDVSPLQTVAPVTALAPPATRPSMPAYGSVDAMVAAVPSRENPFLTRKNRARRAHWLVRTGQVRRTEVAEAAIGTSDTIVRDRWREQRLTGGRPGLFNWRPSNL